MEEPEKVEEEDVPEPTREEVLASKTEEELDELEDDDEFADDRFMAEYRRKRMAELASKMAKDRFGDVSFQLIPATHTSTYTCCLAWLGLAWLSC